MKKIRFSSLCFIFILMSCTEQAISNFSVSITDQWTFRQSGKTKWYKTTIPSEVHIDLLNHQLIGDPYWENNELGLQWVGKSDWEYKTKFNISKSQLKMKGIELEFKGLDTYAEVSVNGHHILSADNMFRSWQLDVKKYLKLGENTIDIVFKSPISVNRALVETYPHKLPSGCETVDLKVGAFTRKAAYHFGWDWGPRFVTAGIWRPVQLNFWQGARIVNVNNQTIELTDTSALVLIEVEIEAQKKISNTAKLSINGQLKPISLNQGRTTIVDSIRILNPKLWWSNGLGAPYLYDLNVGLVYNGAIIDEQNQKFGVRTIELVTEPDSIGTSFYFKLNGQPVFMKGANYIPQDMFLPRVTDSRYHELIAQVKTANMNMLRVWGGGIYENDIFYELCDANGILVWQDFMFAGSLYPSTKPFINTVSEEVTENIKRLRHHPCIALWCGNNEIEVAWENWGWKKQYGYSSQDSAQIWRDYQMLFQELIPNKVKTYHPQGNYTSTSPISNWGTASNFNHSTMHYWGVWHGKEGFEGFNTNIGRFMVEYGFQSFPSLKSLKTVAHDSSLYLASNMMINRQKSYIGNGMLLREIINHFERPENFADFVKLSQKTQAIAYEMAITAHMGNQPHCMGTLFWQLNDCWPGPSWSVIEYDGTEKEAYQTVKRLYLD